MKYITAGQINNFNFDEISQLDHHIDYIPNSIDEYIVIVKNIDDWEEIHNYIIDENEIDGIPNRRINCSNIKEYSLRSSIYEMSVEEANILRTHPKVETVELNPEKYPQSLSIDTNRYKKQVAFNKPLVTGAVDSPTTTHTNGIRSNWNHLFVNNPTSEPFVGAGIVTTTLYETDIEYSLTGKDVDAVIIDEGVAYLHPEFKRNDGTYRVKDVILDGPYKVDPNYFIDNNLTFTKIVDGVDLGVGISTVAAREWWSDSSKRSSAFQSLGTVSINSSYDLQHVSTKTTNSNSNQLVGGHGTACASQIGGKTFGLAFESNIWNIRIRLGGIGIIGSDVALDVCSVFHQAKKISQNGNPDPTLINASFGGTLSCGNNSSTIYTHGFRGQTLNYTGNNSLISSPANSGACRNVKVWIYHNGSYVTYGAYSGSGLYAPPSLLLSSNSSAENAINAGCILVSAAGNTNQKLCDSTDIDYNNWYGNSSNFICRVGGVQKGHSGTDTKFAGTIRVGALDCAVEPHSEKQGVSKYSIRKVCYSANGPMINVWAPGEKTMAAGYTSTYEDYAREDDSNFYDTWFNGTSAACPNACSVIALYLESNRKANQHDVHLWLNRHGSVEANNLSDPYSDPNNSKYFSATYNGTYDAANSQPVESYNLSGCGNLRGAPKRVLFNPFANSTIPTIEGAEISGVSFEQS